jgi:hypothetical protein
MTSAKITGRDRTAVTTDITANTSIISSGEFSPGRKLLSSPEGARKVEDPRLR